MHARTHTHTFVKRHLTVCVQALMHVSRLQVCVELLQSYRSIDNTLAPQLQLTSCSSKSLDIVVKKPEIKVYINSSALQNNRPQTHWYMEASMVRE